MREKGDGGGRKRKLRAARTREGGGSGEDTQAGTRRGTRTCEPHAQERAAADRRGEDTQAGTRRGTRPRNQPSSNLKTADTNQSAITVHPRLSRTRPEPPGS